jgi:peroxiredoxin
MKENKASSGKYSKRLQELQQRFRELEKQIADPGTREAFSIMNGMLQELWRNVSNVSGNEDENSISLDEIANMYRNAPKMEGPAINSPLPEGTRAPDFRLQDADGNQVKLSDFRGSTLLLVFYPLDWSPGCSQQLDLYQQEIKEFEKRDVKIAGISVDSIYSHGAWAAIRNISFPLLADFNPKGEVAKKYNVYRESDGFTERALYFIDGEGVIRYSHVSPFIHHIPDIYGLFRKLDEIRKPVISV